MKAELAALGRMCCGSYEVTVWIFSWDRIQAISQWPRQRLLKSMRKSSGIMAAPRMRSSAAAGDTSSGYPAPQAIIFEDSHAGSLRRILSSDEFMSSIQEREHLEGRLAVG